MAQRFVGTGATVNVNGQVFHVRSWRVDAGVSCTPTTYLELFGVVTPGMEPEHPPQPASPTAKNHAGELVLPMGAFED